MSKNIQATLDEKTAKTITVLTENLASVRAGRANPALLDKVMVDYYGVATPLKNLANISVPDPKSLMVAPFDTKAIGEVEKAINIADIGINPINDGKVIRLQIPDLTEERRVELTKLVKQFGEDAKIAIRNERREANDKLKKLEKDHEISEDDLKGQMADVQDKTDESIKEIDNIITEKEAEILEV